MRRNEETEEEKDIRVTKQWKRRAAHQSNETVENGIMEYLSIKPTT